MTLTRNTKAMLKQIGRSLTIAYDINDNSTELFDDLLGKLDKVDYVDARIESLHRTTTLLNKLAVANNVQDGTTTKNDAGANGTGQPGFHTGASRSE